MPAEAAGTLDAVGQEPSRSLLALPGLGTIPGTARRTLGMEIPQEGGPNVPGVPSTVPSLFQICSQIPASTFNVFPTFSVPDIRAISSVFCILFSGAGTLGTLGTQLRWKALCVEPGGTLVERLGTDVSGRGRYQPWP